MRLAMAQINPTVGDLQGNLQLIRDAIRRGEEGGADLVVLPELCISGYPPKDLLERPFFVKECREALDELAGGVRDTAALIGFPEENTGSTGKPVFNSCAFVERSEIVSVVRKSLLPTYDIFDENRHFEPSPVCTPVRFRDHLIGLTICEDLWYEAEFWPKRIYRTDPVPGLVADGAEIIINSSSSPYDLGKEDFRRHMLRNRAQKIGLPIIYVNQVGGNDELVFDGNSLAFAADGSLLARGKPFEEDFLIADTTAGDPIEWEEISLAERLHQALVLGTRDYARKCGFSKAVVGLSGGIDSALTVSLAVDALGKDNVLGVSMPSRYSSEGSVADARTVAENLGIELKIIPIEPAFKANLDMLGPTFEGREPDVTEENIQARIRGGILMAISNKFGHLVLSTGNKSELAVGYCTLYGDMVGGLAVIADVPKTRVYELARHLNRDRTIIPESTLTKAPSAELRPDQTDQDSLPPYEVLDPILEAYVEEAKDVSEIVAQGFDRSVVMEVIRRVDTNEYKRYQAAPALKVTPRAFGTGWRMPIAQGYKHK
jgi:NAD+ synthetase